MDKDYLLNIAELFLEDEKLPEGWDTADGATRYVLINDEIDWVIKIDNHPSIMCGCQAEYKHYCEAVNRDLQNYFAEIRPLGTASNGQEVFIQRKCEIDPDATTRSFTSYLVEEQGWDEESTHNYDIEPEESLTAMFGYEPKLLSFIEDFGINDLHEANYGYDENFSPVLIDYAGYHGW